MTNKNIKNIEPPNPKRFSNYSNNEADVIELAIKKSKELEKKLEMEMYLIFFLNLSESIHPGLRKRKDYFNEKNTPKCKILFLLNLRYSKKT
jgi:hypothetical protein